MNSKVYFLVNKHAGKGRGGLFWEKAEERLSEIKHTYKVEETTGKYSSFAQVDQAISDGYNIIVAIGGDGTTFEVINAIMERKKQGDISENIMVLPWACGTGCDGMRLLRTDFSVDNLIKVINEGENRKFDLMKINITDFNGEEKEIYGFNSLCIGLSAETSYSVSRSPLKNLGKISYPIFVLYHLLRNKPYRMKVKVDGEFVLDEFKDYALAGIHNGVYIGGGIPLSPRSKLDDNKINLVLIDRLKYRSMIPKLIKLIKGEHLDDEIVYTKEIDTAEIITNKNYNVDVDGEQVGTSPLKVGICPNAIDILC